MRAVALVGIWCGLAGPAWGAAFALRADGVQIYGCVASGAGFAWRFKAPEAALTDSAGAPAGRHFAGPSWQARDGSLVRGAVIGSGAAPLPGAVPWLVLRAAAHEGEGVFAGIGFITRTQTEGGVAPALGCDAAHVGQEARVPYRALYSFFPGG